MKLNKILLYLTIIILTCITHLYIEYSDIITTCKNDKKPYPFYTTSNNGNHLIAHAGGSIDGHIYTNSKEAWQQALSQGLKFIEVDLCETTDGYYAAVHDWELFNHSIGSTGNKPLSLTTINSSKIYGKYTPLDEKQINQIMHNNPQLTMVTDKSRDVKHIAKAFPFHDRMIVETFHIYDYIKALKVGIKYPALRLKGGRHGIPAYYKKLIEFLNIKAITIGELSFKKNINYIKELHDKGVTVLLYGNPSNKIVESPNKIKEYAGKYVDLFYSNSIHKLPK